MPGTPGRASGAASALCQKANIFQGPRGAPETLQQALAAAGVQATIPLKSKIGRAAWIAERTVGHQDPGATSFYLMLKSAVEYLTEKPEN